MPIFVNPPGTAAPPSAEDSTTIGAATAETVNKVTITEPATGATLTIDDGFTLHATGNVTALSGSHTGTNTGDQTLTSLGVTAAAQTVLDDTTVAAMVDTLGGASSTGTGGLVRATSPTLVTPNLGTPSACVGTNITGTAAGLDAGTCNASKWKEPVIVASTANVNVVTGVGMSNGSSMDGFTLSTGDRILLKDQTSVSENGIYTVQASGAAVRASDLAAGMLATNACVFVQRGTLSTDQVYVCTKNASAATVGVDNLTWANLVDLIGGATSTGTGGVARKTNAALTTPDIGTPSAGTLTNCTGLPTAGHLDDSVTDAKLRNSAALSVIGRTANSSGDPADIAAAANGDSLERYNDTVVFQSHAGTSFPTNKYNGMRYIRTDLDYCEFLYDGGRSIWRSVQSFELAFTLAQTVTAGAWFKLFQALTGTAAIGYSTKWTCVVTEISAFRLTTGGATTTADLYDGSSIVTGASISVTTAVTVATTTGLNVAVASGALLNCLVNAGTNNWNGGGHVIYTLHRTAT